MSLECYLHLILYVVFKNPVYRLINITRKTYLPYLYTGIFFIQLYEGIFTPYGIR